MLNLVNNRPHNVQYIMLSTHMLGPSKTIRISCIGEVYVWICGIWKPIWLADTSHGLMATMFGQIWIKEPLFNPSKVSNASWAPHWSAQHNVLLETWCIWAILVCQLILKATNRTWYSGAAMAKQFGSRPIHLCLEPWVYHSACPVLFNTNRHKNLLRADLGLNSQACRLRLSWTWGQ